MILKLRILVCMAAVAISSSVSFAQGIAIGAVGGIRATGDLTGSGAFSASKRYVVGPQLDIGLSFGLGIEVDALYRHQGYHSNYNGTADERASSWEFPLLLKYRFSFPLVKPFVEGGYAPRVINGSTHYYANGTTQGTDYPASHGLVIGGGVRFGIGRLSLSPAVRYTHWNIAPITMVFADGPTFQSTQNQADILLGISWKLR